jgi:hypothetical protein
VDDNDKRQALIDIEVEMMMHVYEMKKSNVRVGSTSRYSMLFALLSVPRERTSPSKYEQPS